MKEITENFSVYGMSCAACSARVENAVRKTEGVRKVSVNLLTGEMRVTFSDPATKENIISAVEKAGYSAAVLQRKNIKSAPIGRKNAEIKEMIGRLVPSVIILVFLMYLSMGHMIGLPLPSFLSGGGAYLLAIVEAVLSLAVLFINRKFFISGALSLVKLAPNMDALVALGSGTSFIYSLVLTVLMIVYTASGETASAQALVHELYFEGAAMIVTLITVGKTLESYSKGRTTDAINALMALAPETATILIDGEEKTVPVEDVKIGDIIVIKTGDYIPVDAVIKSGAGSIDQSAMTGESIPVDKTVGDKVFSGTVNLNGYFTAVAEKVGEDTSLNKIIELVKNVNLSKAPIAKTADRVSAVFVPSVIAIALITLFVWLVVGAELSFALQRAVAVLLISCPCALGLATPVAIMVGSGVGAKTGVLFKSATSLENLGKTRTVVFDKTGTLTYGKPTVTDVIPAEKIDETELLNYASSLEALSEHPLSEAVVKRFSGSLPVENFRSMIGFGLEGEIDGVKVLGGNVALMEKNGVDVSSLLPVANKLSGEGKTPLYFAKGKTLLGIIAVADREKTEAKEIILALKHRNIACYLLTGDNENTAVAIAERIGIERDNVFAGTLPDDKAKIVSDLKKNGVVAMVGDGVNDAPSLSSADIGVTLENGSFVAAEAAEIMLLGDLDNFVSAVDLSRKVIRNVKENLFWAFFYNVICIPVAAGAFYSVTGWSLSPMLAALAMSLSSVFVVTNALRLNFFKPYRSCAGGVCPVALSSGENENEKTIKENIEMNITKTFTVKGMMCAHCEARVKKAVEAIDGVVSCTPDHNADTAVVSMSENVSPEAIKAAIEAEGYEVIL